MNIENEKNNSYKHFLKSFLKIRNKVINNTNFVSFDLFVSTTRVYKFSTLKWSKAIKKQAEKCQEILLENICDTFKYCSSIKATSEVKLIEQIFNKFSENPEHLKTLDNFVNFSIDDLNIKSARLSLSRQDKEEYHAAMQQFNRLNLFYFKENNNYHLDSSFDKENFELE